MGQCGPHVPVFSAAAAAAAVHHHHSQDHHSRLMSNGFPDIPFEWTNSGITSIPPPQYWWQRLMMILKQWTLFFITWNHHRIMIGDHFADRLMNVSIRHHQIVSVYQIKNTWLSVVQCILLLRNERMVLSMLGSDIQSDGGNRRQHLIQLGTLSVGSHLTALN